MLSVFVLLLMGAITSFIVAPQEEDYDKPLLKQWKRVILVCIAVCVLMLLSVIKGYR